MQDYRALPYDELQTLHREIGTLLEQRRQEAFEQLKQQIAVLGFSVDDLVPKKKRARASSTIRYRDPDVPENVWSGRGKRPAWLRDKLDQGYPLDQFLIGSS